MKWLGPPNSLRRHHGATRFERCTFDVTQPDVYPWEHNQKVFWRACKAPASFVHEGAFICTHHAKSIALRLLVEKEDVRP